MSTEHPRRELEDPDVPEELRSALKSAQQAGPSPERFARARDAMLARAAHHMASAGAATAGLGAAAMRNPVSGAGAGAAAHSGGRLVGWLGTWTGKTLLLGSVLTGAVGLWLWNDASSAPAVATPAPRTAPSVAPATPPAPEPEVEPVAEVAEPSEVVEAEPSKVITAEPSEAASAVSPEVEEPRRAPRARRARRAKPAPAKALGLQDEIALLTKARSALQDRPAETLRLAAEHEALFPSGRFEQEREVLAVHALLRRGKREQALERGAGFLAKFPNSTHARRVTALLEEATP